VDEFEMVYSPTMTDASEILNSNSFDDVTTISNTIVQQGSLPQTFSFFIKTRLRVGG